MFTSLPTGKGRLSLCVNVDGRRDEFGHQRRDDIGQQDGARRRRVTVAVPAVLQRRLRWGGGGPVSEQSDL